MELGRFILRQGEGMELRRVHIKSEKKRKKKVLTQKGFILRQGENIELRRFILRKGEDIELRFILR